MTVVTDRAIRRLGRTPAAYGVAAIVLLLLGVGPALSQQGAVGPLTGFSRDEGPINIQSDSLTINDLRKVATYKGNVVVVQGVHTLRTVELEVQYVSKDDPAGAKGAKSKTAKAALPASGAGDESQQIKRIRARQQVVMTSAAEGKEAQSATADTADYDVLNQIIELRGNVYMRQGENVVCGSKVTMNLNTSEYSVERDPAAPPPTRPECGRVSSVFFPTPKGNDKAAPATTPAGAKAKSQPAQQPAAKQPAQAKQPEASSWTATTSTPH